jgi:hypothetical protein
MLQDMRPAAVAFPDFNHSSFLVIWEVTRACALARVHCRADAGPPSSARAHDRSRTDEVFRLLRNGNALFAKCGRYGFRDDLWRIAIARLRGDRRGDGVGSAMRVRGRSGQETAGADLVR